MRLGEGDGAGAVARDFTADLADAAAATEGDATAWLREQVVDRGVIRLPCEAWLDDDGRLRRLRYTLALDQSPTMGTAAGSGEVETTVSTTTSAGRWTSPPRPRTR